ncbi:hypothetical protein QQP08_003413 [Theobroma cacao]|nr:hypothetical protein QQP08_003413 [Theobroma cacao]
MSIVPISGQDGTVTDPVSLDLWDPFNNLDLWNPFTHGFPFTFPSYLSTHSPGFSSEIFPSLGTQLNWRETPRAHVFKAFLPGVTRNESRLKEIVLNVLFIASKPSNFPCRNLLISILVDPLLMLNGKNSLSIDISMEDNAIIPCIALNKTD